MVATAQQDQQKQTLLPDVLIVGAGVFGLTTAIQLASEGRTCKLFDRFEPPVPDGSSNDLNRVVRIDYGSKGVEQALAFEAIKKWRKWEQDVRSSNFQFSDTTDKKDTYTLFDECGILLTCQSEQLGPFEQSCVKNFQETGCEDHVTLLTTSEIAEKFPALSDATRNRFPCGYYNKLGGYVDSKRCLEYLYHIAKSMSNIQFHFGVSGTATQVMMAKEDTPETEIGEAIAVQTFAKGILLEDGSSHLGTVVFATGAWSANLIPQLRPLMIATGQPLFYLRLPEHLRARYTAPHLPVWMGDLYQTGLFAIPATRDGILKFGRHTPGYVNVRKTDVPTTPEDHVSVPRTRVDHPSDTIPPADLDNFRNLVAQCFPELKEAEIFDAKLCWYCTTFDERFIISEVPFVSNLFVATGGSGHGFKFAPVLGQICSDVVQRRKTKHTEYFAWRNALPSDATIQSEEIEDNADGKSTTRRYFSKKIPPLTDMATIKSIYKENCM